MKIHLSRPTGGLKEGTMYYIALLKAYQDGEKADNWFSANYMQALQILIVREYELNY